MRAGNPPQFKFLSIYSFRSTNDSCVRFFFFSSPAFRTKTVSTCSHLYRCVLLHFSDTGGETQQQSVFQSVFPPNLHCFQGWLIYSQFYTQSISIKFGWHVFESLFRLSRRNWRVTMSRKVTAGQIGHSGWICQNRRKVTPPIPPKVITY